MNRRELVLALSERMETDRRTADDMLTAFTDIVTETVSTGDPVAISGFCKFARRDSPARMGRNPATGETIRIAAKRRVRVTPLKAFKDAVLSGRTVKKAAKKTTAKKTTAKKTAAKKTVAKRAPAKKTTAAKRAPAKRATAAKRTPARKTTARKTTARR